MVLACIVLGAIIGIIASATLGNIAFFVLGFRVVWYLLRDQIAKVLKGRRKPTTFGSAEWATLAHLQENNLTGEKGFRLGASRKRQSYPLHYAGDRHLLTVAPTRSGKGVSSIIPNLLTYQGSVIVIDPKGENARESRRRGGVKVTAVKISRWHEPDRSRG